ADVLQRLRFGAEFLQPTGDGNFIELAARSLPIEPGKEACKSYPITLVCGARAFDFGLVLSRLRHEARILPTDDALRSAELTRKPPRGGIGIEPNPLARLLQLGQPLLQGFRIAHLRK